MSTIDRHVIKWRLDTSIPVVGYSDFDSCVYHSARDSVFDKANTSTFG